MSEGVRDDFKAMTEIYSRLCTYLDLAATNPPPPLHRGGPGEQASVSAPADQSSSPSAASGDPPATGTVNISTGAATDFVPPASASAAAAAPASAAQGTDTPPEVAPGTAPAGVLSTFIAAAPSFSSPSASLPAGAGSAAADGAGVSGGSAAAGGGGTAEGLAALEEGLLGDLDVSEHVMFVGGMKGWLGT